MCRFCLALYLLYQLAGFAFWWSDGFLFELNRLDCTQACLSLLSDAGWGKNCLSRSAKVKHLMDMDERFCPSVWDAFAGMFFFWEASDRVWGGGGGRWAGPLVKVEWWPTATLRLLIQPWGEGVGASVLHCNWAFPNPPCEGLDLQQEEGVATWKHSYPELQGK